MKPEQILIRAKELTTTHGIKLHEALIILQIEHAKLPVWTKVWLWFKGE